MKVKFLLLVHVRVTPSLQTIQTKQNAQNTGYVSVAVPSRWNVKTIFYLTSKKDIVIIQSWLTVPQDHVRILIIVMEDTLSWKPQHLPQQRKLKHLNPMRIQLQLQIQLPQQQPPLQQPLQQPQLQIRQQLQLQLQQLLQNLTMIVHTTVKTLPLETLLEGENACQNFVNVPHQQLWTVISYIQMREDSSVPKRRDVFMMMNVIILKSVNF